MITITVGPIATIAMAFGLGVVLGVTALLGYVSLSDRRTARKTGYG